MLSRMLLGATGSVRYVGSVTKGANNEGSWDESGDALNVLSIAETGDLVIIAFTFYSGPGTVWSWAGMTFTDILDNTASNGYVGYRVVEAGDTNPYVTGLGAFEWTGLSIVASVFRGDISYTNASTDTGSGAMPTPPSLTANGKLWVVTGGLTGPQGDAWGMPTGYTQAGFKSHTSTINTDHKSSTAIAYKFETDTSDTPSAFTGSVTRNWLAATIALS